MARDKIKAFVDEKEVPCLLHFTHISNLESILQNGLLSRDKVNEMGGEHEVNDELRLDNHTDTISVSIAHPNSPMLYKYRNEKAGEWCIIGIKKRVLWKQDVLFCKHNAADGRMFGKSTDYLSSIDAFKSMYDEGIESRADQGLKVFDPTDVQAEVLVFDEIELKDIRGVVFPSEAAKQRYAHLLGDLDGLVNVPDRGYFARRAYKRMHG